MGSTYVVEQISFSMFPSILTFEFDLISGSFLNFWGPKGLFLKTVLGSTHVVEQISFSMFLSILTFDFTEFCGHFFTFWGPNGLILGLG